MLLFLLSLLAVVDGAAFFSIINSIFITTTIIYTIILHKPDQIDGIDP